MQQRSVNLCELSCLEAVFNNCLLLSSLLGAQSGMFVGYLCYDMMHYANHHKIPAVFITAYGIMGIEQIGVQIENPFGYDYSDLHMEAFCKVTQCLTSYKCSSLCSPLFFL